MNITIENNPLEHVDEMDATVGSVVIDRNGAFYLVAVNQTGNRQRVFVNLRTGVG